MAFESSETLHRTTMPLFLYPSLPEKTGTLSRMERYRTHSKQLNKHIIMQAWLPRTGQIPPGLCQALENSLSRWIRSLLASNITCTDPTTSKAKGQQLKLILKRTCRSIWVSKLYSPRTLCILTDGQRSLDDEKQGFPSPLNRAIPWSYNSIQTLLLLESYISWPA